MKRLVSVCLTVALIALCTGASAVAGPVRVKLLGKALNDYPGTWSIVNGLDVAGKGGGFIMSHSCQMDDLRPENLKAMIDFTKEYGVYH